MRKLTEAEYQKLVKAEERAERFSDLADRRLAQVNQLTEDLLEADAEAAELRLSLETHQHVLVQVWGLWHANRRIIVSMMQTFNRLHRARAWLRAWLNEDKVIMVKILSWANDQVNGSGLTGDASPRD